MIKTVSELITLYSKAFRLVGGNPEACEGVAWLKEQAEVDQSMSADKIIAAINAKISGGTAHHGWLIAILSLLWHRWSADQRLVMIKALSKGGANKWIIGKGFASKLTLKERKYLEGELRKSNAFAALRYLNG